MQVASWWLDCPPTAARPSPSSHRHPRSEHRQATVFLIVDNLHPELSSQIFTCCAPTEYSGSSGLDCQITSALMTGVDNAADEAGADLGRIHLQKKRLNIANRNAARVHRNDLLSSKPAKRRSSLPISVGLQADQGTFGTPGKPGLTGIRFLVLRNLHSPSSVQHMMPYSQRFRHPRPATRPRQLPP